MNIPTKHRKKPKRKRCLPKTAKKPRRSTKIYFIQVGNFIKIGRTSDMEKRIDQMATNSPYQPRVLAVFRVGKMASKWETLTHKIFHHHRHRGEWFRFDDEILEFIARIKSAETPEFFYLELEADRHFNKRQEGQYDPERREKSIQDHLARCASLADSGQFCH